jgi:hypothetical protein
VPTQRRIQACEVFVDSSPETFHMAVLEISPKWALLPQNQAEVGVVTIDSGVASKKGRAAQNVEPH